MKYQTFKIDKQYDSIYHFLKHKGFSENYIKNLRKIAGNIIVNNEIVNIRKPLKENDIIKINSNPNEKTSVMQCKIPLDIVFEDDYYLLINKPSGLACMPSRSHFTNNLAGAIAFYMSSKDDNFVVRILNRLDKDTEGIIIVAKDSISQKEIKDIDKTYVAICEGRIISPLIVDKSIATITDNGVNQRKRIISKTGQKAITHIEPITTGKTHSLIRLKLDQGRTHQIRLHLSSINHPLIGDELYGKKSEMINHTALICKEISFYHPYLNNTLRFEIDFPIDFQNVISNLF